MAHTWVVDTSIRDVQSVPVPLAPSFRVLHVETLSTVASVEESDIQVQCEQCMKWITLPPDVASDDCQNLGASNRTPVQTRQDNKHCGQVLIREWRKRVV
jgi:hypothetical protein